MQYFVLLLGDSRAVYVAIALTVCLKKGKEWPLDQRSVHKETQYTRENLTRDLWASEPNDYKFFCGCMVHYLISHARLLPLQSLKEILTCKKQSLPVSVCPPTLRVLTLTIFLTT